MPQQKNPKPDRRDRGQGKRNPNISKYIAARLDFPQRTFTLKWIPNVDTPHEPSLAIMLQPMLRGIELTSLTMEELMMFKAFMDTAVDLAKPIVERLDAQAQWDLEHGLGINRRLYRPPSQLLNFGTPPPLPYNYQPNPTTGDNDNDSD